MKRLMEEMTELDLEFACALRSCPGRGRPRRPCLRPNVDSDMEKKCGNTDSCYFGMKSLDGHHPENRELFLSAVFRASWDDSTRAWKDICNQLLHELCKQPRRFGLDTSTWREFLKYHFQKEIAILDSASSSKNAAVDLQTCRERKELPKLDAW